MNRRLLDRGRDLADALHGLADSEDPVSIISIVLAIETLRDDRRDTQLSIPFLRLILMMIN